MQDDLNSNDSAINDVLRNVCCSNAEQICKHSSSSKIARRILQPNRSLLAVPQPCFSHVFAATIDAQVTSSRHQVHSWPTFDYNRRNHGPGKNLQANGKNSCSNALPFSENAPSCAAVGQDQSSPRTPLAYFDDRLPFASLSGLLFTTCHHMLALPSQPDDLARGRLNCQFGWFFLLVATAIRGRHRWIRRRVASAGIVRATM